MLDLNKKEPTFFINYKNKDKKYRKKPNNYQECDSNIKKSLRENIVEEQNYQCFYCEKKINTNTEKIHIDHIKQRNYYHTLECEYKNMVISCNGKGEKHCAKYKDKIEKWDDDKFIRLIPNNINLSEKSSDFFKFVSNGKIKVKKNLSDNEKDRGSNTISYLNLNFKDLIDARRVVLQRIAIYKQQNIDIATIFTYFNEFESLFK